MLLSCEQIARVCYEANRAYSMSLGDFSLSTWDMAPQWQKDSQMSGVREIMANPNVTPAQIHEKWVDEKKASGWKHGPVKRPEALEHPSLLPYGKLPESERVKDVLLIAIVRSLSPVPVPASPEKPRSEEAVESSNEILTPEGDVVKDGEIVQDVKPGKKKRGV